MKPIVGNSHFCKSTGHTCVGNSHSCKDTGHTCIGNSHSCKVTDHTCIGNSHSCKGTDHTCIGNSHSCKGTGHTCICTDHLHPKYWLPLQIHQVDISIIFFRQVSEEDHVTHQLTVFLAISDSCWKLWEVLTYHTKGHGEGRRKEGRNEE